MSIGSRNIGGWIPCRFSFPSSNLFGYLGRLLRSFVWTWTSRHVSCFTQIKIKKISKKTLSIQQFKTLTCRRNLNDYVTKKTHLPMKLSSDKALRAYLWVDPRTQVTCPSPVSVLPTIVCVAWSQRQRALHLRIPPSGSLKIWSDLQRLSPNYQTRLPKLSPFYAGLKKIYDFNRTFSIKKNSSPMVRASSPIKGWLS